MGSGVVVGLGVVVGSIFPSWVGSEGVVGWGALVGSEVVVGVVAAQEGMRGLETGRRGHGFRIRAARLPRQAPLDAPAVARPRIHMGAGNVPSVRSKRAREVYRRREDRREDRREGHRRHREECHHWEECHLG